MPPNPSPNTFVPVVDAHSGPVPPAHSSTNTDEKVGAYEVSLWLRNVSSETSELAVDTFVPAMKSSGSSVMKTARASELARMASIASGVRTDFVVSIIPPWIDSCAVRKCKNQAERGYFTGD